MEEEAEDEESSVPVLDARSELVDVAACAILLDEETVDSDEAEAEAVSAATDEADGLRMTSMDCDFSSRLSVCNTNGALLPMLLLLLLLLLLKLPLPMLPPSELRPRRLLSVLRLRDAVLKRYWRSAAVEVLDVFFKLAVCSSTDSSWLALIGVCNRIVLVALPMEPPPAPLPPWDGVAVVSLAT